jgi:hypothetical protein
VSVFLVGSVTVGSERRWVAGGGSWDTVRVAARRKRVEMLHTTTVAAVCCVRVRYVQVRATRSAGPRRRVHVEAGDPRSSSRVAAGTPGRLRGQARTAIVTPVVVKIVLETGHRVLENLPRVDNLCEI